MPTNSTGQLAIWKNADALDVFALSPQDTGVRVRAVPLAGTSVELPAGPPNDGDTYTVQDADGSASLANQITVTPPAGTTIRGLADYTIFLAHGGAVFTFDSETDDWSVFVSNVPPLPVAGTTSYVIWKPGVPSSGQTVESPSEIAPAILAGAIGLIIDSSVAPANLPPGAYDWTRLQWIAAFNNQFAQSVGVDLMTVEDGAVITDFPRNNLNGLRVLLACNTTSPLVYSNTSPELFGSFSGMQVAALATVPACSVPVGTTMIVWGDRGFQVASLQAGVPFFLVHGTLEFLAFAALGINATTIAVAAGGTCIFRGDASNPIPSFTNAGTLINFPFDSDQAMAYGHGAAFPASPAIGQPFLRTDQNVHYTWNGTTWVIAAFQNTTTGGRPVTTIVGQMDFDTTLGIPIWWSGAAWVNAVGAPV